MSPYYSIGIDCPHSHTKMMRCGVIDDDVSDSSRIEMTQSTDDGYRYRYRAIMAEPLVATWYRNRWAVIIALSSPQQPHACRPQQQPAGSWSWRLMVIVHGLAKPVWNRNGTEPRSGIRSAESGSRTGTTSRPQPHISSHHHRFHGIFTYTWPIWREI